MDIGWKILLPTLLLSASTLDILYSRIPNILTFSFMAGGLAYHSYTSGLDGFILSLAGLVLGIMLLLTFYLIGGMGAGDVKLMGAVGAVLGPKTVLNAFLFTGIIGGIYAVVIILFRFEASKKLLNRIMVTLRALLSTGNFIPIPAAEDEKPPKLCYGIAIAIGALVTIWLKAANYNLPI